MKKEYHYTISRTDRICLISFVVILLGWELIKEFFPSGEKSFIYISPIPDQYERKEKKEYTYSPDYSSKKHAYSHSRNFEKQFSSYQEEQEQSVPSGPISIMSASIEELTSIGLSRKVAYNIQKFISAGGMITGEKDLLKIYGMDSMQLNKAKSLIIYASLDEGPTTNDPYHSVNTKQNNSTMIDLNIATVEDLESLNGIGPVLAERILKFRESIGGFISPSQLADCYGFPPETFEKIKDQIRVSGSPQVILINEVNLDSLSHPYLSKKLTRMIKAYKKQHGDFRNETDLRKVYPPDSNWCKKILPYLSFETND